MADDLSNYKLQLQQVEVALLTDPANSELLKLKEDIGQYLKFFWIKEENYLVFHVYRATHNTTKRVNKNSRR